jgi:hypothetical protein
MRPMTRLLLLSLLAPLALIVACGDDDVLTQLPFLPPPPEEYAPTCASRLERDSSVTLLRATDAEAMAGVTLVRGSLTIATSGAAALDDGIDCVERIEGDLIIEDVRDLETIGPNGLSRLEVVTGDIIVRGNPDLRTPLPLFALTTVGGDLTVEDNPALRSIGDMAVLESIGGGLVLRNNADMGFVPSMGTLSSLGGDLIVDGAGDLEELALSSFTVAGTLRVANNASLTSARLPSVASGAAGIEIEGNARLETLVMIEGPAAADITGDLVIASNAALISVTGFASLAEVGGDALIEDNAALQTIEGFDRFWHVVGDLRVAGNGALISTSALNTLLTVDGGVALSGNAALAGVQLGNLTSIGETLAITDNAVLLTLDGMDALLSVGGLVQIAQNPMLSTCDAEALVDRLVANGLPAENAQIAQNGDC